MNFPVHRIDPGARAMGASVRPAGTAVPAAGRAKDEAALKQSAKDLEGLFVQQLFQAMRAAVPTDGLLERGPGEDLFSSMLDQRIAQDVAERGDGPRDLSVSLYEALRDRLGPSADTAR